MNVLQHNKFLTGNLDTYFIDENPQLFQFRPSQNRAQKLLWYLGNVIVNGPMSPLATELPAAKITPTVPVLPPCKLFTDDLLAFVRVATSLESLEMLENLMAVMKM